MAMTMAAVKAAAAATLRKPTANLSDSEAMERLDSIIHLEHAQGFDTNVSRSAAWLRPGFADFRNEWLDYNSMEQES